LQSVLFANFNFSYDVIAISNNKYVSKEYYPVHEEYLVTRIRSCNLTENMIGTIAHNTAQNQQGMQKYSRI